MTHSQFLGGLHETGRSCISVSTVWDGSSGLIWDLTLTSRNEETGEGKHRWTDRPECVIWSVAVGHRAWICRDHRGVSRRLRPSAAALTHHQLLPPKGRPRVLDNRSLLSHTARGQAARIFDSEVDPPPAIRKTLEGPLRWGAHSSRASVREIVQSASLRNHRRTRGGRVGSRNILSIRIQSTP